MTELETYKPYAGYVTKDDISPLHRNIILFAVKGFSHQTIADAYNTSLDVVERVLHDPTCKAHYDTLIGKQKLAIAKLGMDFESILQKSVEQLLDRLEPADPSKEMATRDLLSVATFAGDRTMDGQFAKVSKKQTDIKHTLVDERQIREAKRLADGLGKQAAIDVAVAEESEEGENVSQEDEEGGAAAAGVAESGSAEDDPGS